MSDRISVLDHGHPVTVTFSSINTYHGGAYPDGIAHALKAMQAAFPVLSERPLERREVHVLTAYSGAGGRDALPAPPGRLAVRLRHAPWPAPYLR